MSAHIPFFIVITGPTAVGKTGFVEDLINELPFSVEILNADMGQMYVPLSIGTAKPDYHNQPTTHHLFDIIDEPKDYTASDYRKKALALMSEITQRGAVPLVVGGSSFYIMTLFYPPCAVKEDVLSDSHYAAQLRTMSLEALWNKLNQVDPKRAEKIHKHDRYRLERALLLWHKTGIQPSLCEPVFDPPGTCAFYFLTRTKEELYERINHRVETMLEVGWLDEVRLLSKPWHLFLKEKKLIGYPEIIRYLDEQKGGYLDEDAYEKLVDRIAQKTRTYAKRQITFWKRLKLKLLESDPSRDYLKKLEEVNLTLLPHALYLKYLTRELILLYRSVMK